MAYAKLIVAAVGAAAAALIIALDDDVLSASEYIQIALAIATALGVWGVPNKPEGV